MKCKWKSWVSVRLLKGKGIMREIKLLYGFNLNNLKLMVRIYKINKLVLEIV